MIQTRIGLVALACAALFTAGFASPAAPPQPKRGRLDRLFRRKRS